MTAALLTLGITSWFGLLRHRPHSETKPEPKSDPSWLEGRLLRRETSSSGDRPSGKLEFRGTYTVRACL